MHGVDSIKFLQEYIQNSITAKSLICDDTVFLSALDGAIKKMESVYRTGGKLLIAGNGGSAADAQHFAAEITGRFKRERKAWPALALHTDTSALTAWSNDYAFSTVYARMVEAHGKKEDALVIISTSGNSENLIEAAKQAQKLGIHVIGLLGKDGGELIKQNLCNHALVIPSKHTPHIQECHIMIIHIICDALDKFFSEEPSTG